MLLRENINYKAHSKIFYNIIIYKMVNKWIEALKQFNRGKGMWCMPKKGSKEYIEVKKIMDNMKDITPKMKTTKKTVNSKSKSKSKSKMANSKKKEKIKKLSRRISSNIDELTKKNNEIMKSLSKMNQGKSLSKMNQGKSLIDQIDETIEKTDLKKRDKNTLFNAIERLKDIQTSYSGVEMSVSDYNGVRARQRTALKTTITKIRMIKDSELKFKLKDMVDQYTNKSWKPYEEKDMVDQITHQMNNFGF